MHLLSWQPRYLNSDSVTEMLLQGVQLARFSQFDWDTTMERTRSRGLKDPAPLPAGVGKFERQPGRWKMFFAVDAGRGQVPRGQRRRGSNEPATSPRRVPGRARQPAVAVPSRGDPRELEKAPMLAMVALLFLQLRARSTGSQAVRTERAALKPATTPFLVW